VLVEVDARDRRSADGAGLAQAFVDSVRRLVRGPALAELQAPGQLAVDRSSQAGDFLGLELGRERIGRKPGGEEDLVRPGAPDAGERALVPEEGVEAAGVGGQDVGEALGSQAVGLRPEVSELLVDRLRSIEADLGPLLRPALGQDQHGAVRERELESRCLRLLLARAQVAEAAGAHEVDVEDELAVFRGEEKVLSAALHALEAAACERRERRVVRLQRGHVRRACLLDREGAHRVVERPL
jgi:hypothetical protein